MTDLARIRSGVMMLKKKNLKLLPFYVFSLLLALTLLWPSHGLGTFEKAVLMQVSQNNKNVELSFSVKKGFGLQKHGPHKITVYSLDSGYQNKRQSMKPRAILKKYGKKLKEYKNYKFSGKAAKEDKDYFSAVNKVEIPAHSATPLAVEAKLYYCSFLNGFCSVEILRYIP